MSHGGPLTLTKDYSTMLGLHLGRSRKDNPAAIATADTRQETGDARLLAAVEALMTSQDIKATDLPDGLLKTALGKLHAAGESGAMRGFSDTAFIAKEASEAAINIGWMTYDVGEVARATQTIAGATEEMAASIAEVAQTSDTVVQVAQSALAAMQGCIGEGQQARAAMQEIDGRTSQISERVVVLERAISQIEVMATAIASISNQTNLLALNATIEAARAGEAGRGFSVVAAEVKSLSAQTAKSTGEIRALLSTLTAEMGAISGAVGESRNAVDRGQGVVDRLERRVAETNEQISQASDLNQAISQMLSQQRSATAEISGSVQSIAAKAAKTHEEIEKITNRLVKAEDFGQTALSVGARAAPGFALVRLPADVGVWKRKLARVLVGLASPDRALGTLSGTPGRAIADALRSSELRSHPALSRFANAEKSAQDQAARMVAAIAVSDWDVGTPAYQAAAAAMKEMLAAAKEMTGASWVAQGDD